MSDLSTTNTPKKVRLTHASHSVTVVAQGAWGQWCWEIEDARLEKNWKNACVVRNNTALVIGCTPVYFRRGRTCHRQYRPPEAGRTRKAKDLSYSICWEAYLVPHHVAMGGRCQLGGVGELGWAGTSKQPSGPLFFPLVLFLL